LVAWREWLVGEAVIVAEGLTKTFTRYRRVARMRRERVAFTAVDKIDLVVQPGELVGYIGPNGAGKSTTIKMLTGILMPTSGVLRVAGLEPQRSRVRLARRIGVVFGQRTTLWWDLPLRDSFTLIQRLYRIPEARYRSNLARYVDGLGLDEFMDQPVRQLSLGQRMRGDITAALLHDPTIVYLDEPTIGLDVVSKHTVRDFLHELNQSLGTTILLTTHDTGDIERLCSRIVAIDHGRVTYDGSVAALRGQGGGDLETAVKDLYLRVGDKWDDGDEEEAAAG
jgi:ABC-2 type transport system ATP-binding protein